MLGLSLGIIIRILSNSYLSVIQKKITQNSAKPSVVNFYTYLGLTIISIPLVSSTKINGAILYNVLIMGILGASGNYFIIKALSIGNLSTLAPINSYKPVVALLIAFLYLQEKPSICATCAIGLIIFGTFFVVSNNNAQSESIKEKIHINNKKAILYRVLALIFSATEAVFIKKIILCTDVSTAFFLWSFSGLLFSLAFVLFARYNFKIKSLKLQLLLVLTVGIMQYFTNYVFSKINVSYALALFQLSTLLTVVFGAKFFGEKNIKHKLLGAIIMVVGAILLILTS